jgi:uncharacterized protein affecting Mg2+/Co2+ transport
MYRIYNFAKELFIFEFFINIYNIGENNTKLIFTHTFTAISNEGEKNN